MEPCARCHRNPRAPGRSHCNPCSALFNREARSRVHRRDWLASTETLCLEPFRQMVLGQMRDHGDLDLARRLEQKWGLALPIEPATTRPAHPVGVPADVPGWMDKRVADRVTRWRDRIERQGEVDAAGEDRPGDRAADGGGRLVEAPAGPGGRA